MYSQYVCLLSQMHVLIDKLLQCALYQQEKVLNNSQTDFIHVLFSIAELYTLSHFSKNNV